MKKKENTFIHDVVMDYVNKHPNSSTNAIARMLLEKEPLLFKNFEQARSSVRYYRDGMGNIRKSIRTEQEKKLAMANFIPKSDYAELKPFIIPNSHNRLLVLSDIHIPYHDESAVYKALKWGKNRGMNAIYLNGDIIDCYMISRFVKDPRLRGMADELEMVREFLRGIKEKYNLPIYYKMGNHEDRWEIYLRQQAPELIGISDFELSKVLRFDEIGIQEIKSKQRAMAGKLSILHGHEFGHSVFSPVNPARGLYMRTKDSCAIGHHHQSSEHSENSLNDKVVTTWSTGALCGMKPDYMPYNKWNLGFLFVEFDKDGSFDVENKKIIKGVIR